MNTQSLIATANALVAKDKGLLAIDESTPTCNKRFAALDIPQTEELRRSYRELIVTTPGLSDYISGVILYDETIRQRVKSGKLMTEILTESGIIVGIKVDMGAKTLAGCPGEKVTEGLDGLRERLAEYARLSACSGSRGAVGRGCIHGSRCKKWPVDSQSCGVRRRA